MNCNFKRKSFSLSCLLIISFLFLTACSQDTDLEEMPEPTSQGEVQGETSDSDDSTPSWVPTNPSNGV
ncbi:hypothetical protein EXS74_00920 [Candidatus Woesearchaeota archaeon]|nr:hypothetical protein [Candidatus Woesearchaeota archaeon]